MEKKNWIVGICCTDADGVNLYRVYGTKDQVKQYLVDCLLSDKDNDPDMYEYGDETVDEVSEERDGTLNAFATYSSYHIDYSAKSEDNCEIEELN